MKERGIEPNAITYSAAISACEKGDGQWEMALELLNEMKERGIEPNVITYSAAISACEKGDGQWEKALELLNDMKERGIEPNAYTYNATIEALYAGLQHNECCRLYREATQSGLYAHVWPHSLKMDLHGCSAAIACTVLGCYLQDIAAAPLHTGIDTITVVTGKGLGSGADGPVLTHTTRAFLTDILGPTVTAVPTNEGRFLLLKDDLLAWRNETHLMCPNNSMLGGGQV
jgi:pentatricopeptide repeat protein